MKSSSHSSITTPTSPRGHWQPNRREPPLRDAPVNPDDGTLDHAAWQNLLSERTRFAAIGYASNLTGSVNPVREMITKAKQVGAITFVDAVHYAPHGRISVRDLQCDFLACSAYKFFGPHEGILWGRRQLLETHNPWKLRPAPSQLPGLWMTGTQSHEAIAGTAAAVEYLAGIADWLPHGSIAPNSTRTQKLDVVFQHLTEYERRLSQTFLDGLRTVPGIRIHGISDPARLQHRVPTFSWTFPDLAPRKAAEWLAGRGLCVWNGNAYALPFTEAAHLEPLGVIRAEPCTTTPSPKSKDSPTHSTKCESNRHNNLSPQAPLAPKQALPH
ncbi:MAG UNVERIFIED_CONTAM: aminotransferase class V-fold PLP-dependent enzyme [Planctomycetaceae bacterium]|jgi:selenocysteine lyase/cysteine desulfurase